MDPVPELPLVLGGDGTETLDEFVRNKVDIGIDADPREVVPPVVVLFVKDNDEAPGTVGENVGLDN